LTRVTKPDRDDKKKTEDNPKPPENPPWKDDWGLPDEIRKEVDEGSVEKRMLKIIEERNLKDKRRGS
jgi:hypothetical protein